MAVPSQMIRTVEIDTAVPAKMPEGSVLETSHCSQGQVNFAELAYVGGDVFPPEKVYAPNPQYTDKARKARIQGVVIAQVVIDEEGCVRRIEVLQGLSPDLNAESVKAMAGWKFRPATRTGKPVAVYYNLTVNFRLR